jgi:hypothetical protein
MPAITVLDLNNAKQDVDHIAAIATSPAPTAVDRLGQTKRTLAGIDADAESRLDQLDADADALLAQTTVNAQVVLAGLGFAPPVAYAAGIVMNATTQTVEYNGNVYAPYQMYLPFITSGVFEVAKFRLIQGVDGATLASKLGSAQIGHSADPADVTVPTRPVDKKLRDWISVLDFVDPAEVPAILNGTSAYDIVPAIKKAESKVGTNVFTFYMGGPRIIIPPGRYRAAQNLNLKRTVRLQGDAVGQAGGYASSIHFDNNLAGIIVNRYNTVGDAEETPTSTGADGSIISGLWIRGGATAGNANLLKSGVRMRARAKVIDCLISGFAGAAICIVASTAVAASDPFHGNANCWYVESCRFGGNLCGGSYVSGGDANAGTMVNCDAGQNGRYGFFDNSFLGNTYSGCHADGNGMFNVTGVITNETGIVTYLGTRYYIAYGQEALGAATTPGTNSAVWVPMGAGGVHANIPTWDGGVTQTYMPGGSYRHVGTANFTPYLGCYSEGGQAPAQVDGSGTFYGGSVGAGTDSGGMFFRGSALGMKINRPFIQEYADPVTAALTRHQFGGTMAGTDPTVLSWNSAVATPFNTSAVAQLKQNKVTGDCALDFYALVTPFRWNGYSTTNLYGRTTATTNRYVTAISKLVIGADNAAVAGRRFGIDASAPTGEVARGEYILTNVPAPSGKAGWVVTTGGTVGSTAVVKQWGVIDA